MLQERFLAEPRLAGVCSGRRRSSIVPLPTEVRLRTGARLQRYSRPAAHHVIAAFDSP
jgi:hypothetical protein